MQFHHISFLGFLLVTILVLTLPLIVLVSQQPQQTQQHAETILPPQGLYESCAPSDGQKCLDRLKQMARGGFKLVVNYDQFSGTQAQELAYAKTAQALGMQIIWGMSDPWWWDGTNLRSHYSDLAASCHCSNNKGFITYVVNLVKSLPGTWGYYVGDEEGSKHTGVKSEGDLVKSLDPNHPRLYVSCGNCDHDKGVTYVTSTLRLTNIHDKIGGKSEGEKLLDAKASHADRPQ